MTPTRRRCRAARTAETYEQRSASRHDGAECLGQPLGTRPGHVDRRRSSSSTSWLQTRSGRHPRASVVYGIIIGSFTALLAFGLALIYRSNRVINFAQADLGAVPASLCVALVAASPAGQGWSYWIALPLVLIGAVVLGSVIERVIIRRFAKAPRLILMVVTIGLAQLLVVLAVVMPYWLADDLIVPAQQLAAAVRLQLRDPPDHLPRQRPHRRRSSRCSASSASSRSCASRASASRCARARRARTARRCSASTSGFTHNVAWMIAAFLSAVTMILRAGTIGLPLGPAFGPSILVQALAAAVIGKMENFPVIFAAACGIGIVESRATGTTSSATRRPRAVHHHHRRAARCSGATRSRASTTRPCRAGRTPPTSARSPASSSGSPRSSGRSGSLRLVVVAFAHRAAVHARRPATRTSRRRSSIYAIIAVSLVLLTGWAGEISLGQVAFVAIGSATAGALNVHYQWGTLETFLAAGVVGRGRVGDHRPPRVANPRAHARGHHAGVRGDDVVVPPEPRSELPRHLVRLPARQPHRPRPAVPDLRHQEHPRRLDSSPTAPAPSSTRPACTSCASSGSGSCSSRCAGSTGGAPCATSSRRATTSATRRRSGSARPRRSCSRSRSPGSSPRSPAASSRCTRTRSARTSSPRRRASARCTMAVVGGLGSVPGAILGAIFLKSTEWFNGVVAHRVAQHVPVRRHRHRAHRRALDPARWPRLAAVPGARRLPPFGRSPAQHGRAVAHRRRVRPRGAHRRQARGRGAGDRRGRARSPIGAPKIFKYFAKRPIPDVNYFSYPDLALSGGTPNLLSLRSVDVAYGQVQVLFGVSLELREGETIALLGTNGAGKSTVLRAISGLVGPKQGSISHLGVDISGLAPHRVAERGLIQVPGGKGVFPSLTVAENLRVGVWMHRRDRVWVKEATAQVLELFPGLKSRDSNDPAAQLSGGQQQMLALAMAFLAKPKVLMIDELSLGLAPLVVEQLLNVVKEFKAQGMTVVLVEQSVNVALTAATKAFFMEKGAIRFHGLTAELLERPELLRSIFLEGAAASQEPSRRRRPRSGAAVTEARRVDRARGERRRAPSRARDPGHHEAVLGHHRRRPRVDQAPRRRDPRHHRAERRRQDHAVRPHLRVPRARRRHGSSFEGRDVTKRRPKGRAQLGLARSFQDARLFGALTVHQTVCVALDRELSVFDPIVESLHLPNVVPRGEEAVEARRRAHRADGPRRLPRQVRVRPLDREPAHRRPRVPDRHRPEGHPVRRAVVGHRATRDRSARAAARAHPGADRREPAADRARHAAHHERLRPHRGDGPRRGRGRRRRRDRAQPPARRRVVPRFERGKRSTARAPPTAKVLDPTPGGASR